MAGDKIDRAPTLFDVRGRRRGGLLLVPPLSAEEVTAKSRSKRWIQRPFERIFSGAARRGCQSGPSSEAVHRRVESPATVRPLPPPSLTTLRFRRVGGNPLEGASGARRFHSADLRHGCERFAPEGEVKFVRFLSPVLAVMHSVVRTTLAGQTKPSPSRDSMELTVVTKRDGE